MKKANLFYLDNLLIHCVEGMYEKKQADLSNYEKYLDQYHAVIGQYSVEEKTATIEGLRSALTVLLNNPGVLDLNAWFNDAALHYLDSDEEVHRLLQRVWAYFFPHDDWRVDGHRFSADDIERVEP